MLPVAATIRETRRSSSGEHRLPACWFWPPCQDNRTGRSSRRQGRLRQQAGSLCSPERTETQDPAFIFKCTTLDVSTNRESNILCAGRFGQDFQKRIHGSFNLISIGKTFFRITSHRFLLDIRCFQPTYQ